jgi:hypothetical protein
LAHDKMEALREIEIWRRTGFVNSKIPEITDL